MENDCSMNISLGIWEKKTTKKMTSYIRVSFACAPSACSPPSEDFGCEPGSYPESVIMESIGTVLQALFILYIKSCDFNVFVKLNLYLTYDSGMF